MKYKYDPANPEAMPTFVVGDTAIRAHTPWAAAVKAAKYIRRHFKPGQREDVLIETLGEPVEIVEGPTFQIATSFGTPAFVPVGSPRFVGEHRGFEERFVLLASPRSMSGWRARVLVFDLTPIVAEWAKEE